MLDFNNRGWHIAAKICTVVFVSLFSIMLMAMVITTENSGAISAFLGSKTFEIIDGDSNEDTEYFKTKYNNVAEVLESGGDLAERIMEEGAVLLKNENNALPLREGSRKVSVFGASCVNPAYGGQGSSSAVKPVAPVTLDAGLKHAGLTVNETLWNFYENNKDIYKINKSFINDAPWSDVTGAAGVSESFATNGDAAIMFIRRIKGEAEDVAYNRPDLTDCEEGNFLKLSPNERSVLAGMKALKDAGTFKRIVVLLNSPNPMEGDFLNDPALGVDAALWVGSLGAAGCNGVGDILAGNVNPSGRLADTYYTEHKFNPAMVNFGASRYTNRDEFVSQLPSEGMNIPGMPPSTILGMYYTSYAVYQEGVYVGYRYSETRYEDYVMGTGKAGDFDYAATIAYPFGYGLSYSEFTYSEFDVKRKGENYEVSVTVTNKGDEPGKEAVQIYLQKPYDTYEKTNDVEKPSVELVGYAKTGLLAKNAKEVVKITVDGRDFASYDANKAKTYYIADGMHYLTAARDAHDAVNNVLAAKKFTPASTNNRMDAAGNATLVKSFDLDFDDKTYAESATGQKITNLFDRADINKYENKGSNSVNYVRRDDWTGTLPQTNVKLALTQAMVDDMLKEIDVTKVEKDADVSYPTYGASKGLMLADMREDVDGNKIKYDDPVWNTFLDQLSWDETAYLVSTGLRKTGIIESVTKPETKDHNGPTGLTQPFGENPEGLAARKNDPDKDVSPTYYPGVNLLASTFSHDITTEYGNQLGEESIWAGYNGFYGIGLNMHRTAYDGRLFEYYSEDPHLSGAAATDVVISIQSHGCYAYIKHFALHEQQDCRIGLHNWLDEQTFREIYLRPFEMTTVKGNAHAAMASFSRAGVDNAVANGALMNGFLRKECGFDGFIVSDMWQIGYKDKNLPIYLMQGLDIPDGDTDGSKAFDAFKPGSGYGNVAQAMRESAHRILYTVAHSNAMNGYSSDTRIKKIMPDWQVAEVVLLVVFGVLMLASIALSVICFVAYEKRRRA